MQVGPTGPLLPVSFDEQLTIAAHERFADLLAAVMAFPTSEQPAATDSTAPRVVNLLGPAATTRADGDTTTKRQMYEAEMPGTAAQLGYLEYARLLSSAGATSQSMRSSWLTDQVIAAIDHGLIAGSFLVYYRILSRPGHGIKGGPGAQAQPSVGLVRYLCSKFNLGREKRQVGRQDERRTVTEELVQAVWRRYQRVSHLWAALIYVRGFPEKIRPNDHILEQVDVSILLFVAYQYERFLLQAFDGQKRKQEKVRRKIVKPLQVRYHDWISAAGPLVLDLPDPPEMVRFVQEVAPLYF